MNDQLMSLLEQALNGDKKAYVTLIDCIRTDLFRIAKIKLDNLEDATDAVHETILKSFIHLNQLRHKEFFKTWIIKILINECNNIYRSNKKQQKIFDILLNHNLIYYKNEIETTDDDLDFDILLKQLNKDEKLVAILYYSNHFNTTEIAHILNVNVNTIKSRLLRAKEKIKLENSKGGCEQNETRK